MRMIIKTGLTIALIFVFTYIMGAEIKFNAPDYAGEAFSFYIIPNFITEKQEVVGDALVNSKGEFACKLNLTTEMPVYCEFGVYKGWFIASPDETIEIALPPNVEKKSSNPYFRPKIIHLGIKNKTAENINILIDNFTRQFNMQMSKNMQQIFYRRSVQTADTVIADLKQQFPKTNNVYFDNFKKYQYTSKKYKNASIKYTDLIQDPTAVMKEYFINQPILYAQPEYSELFDKIFTKYLQYATQQVNGQKISVLLNSGAYEQLIDWLTLDMLFNKTLAESIILKGIKPLFFAKRFNTVGLFNLLQKISETSEVEAHRTSASKIFNELARTMYGTSAPELDLVDINGNFYGWEDFKGKYVYLCFTRTDNEKFVSHKQLMKEFQIKYKDDLAIVIVLEDDDIEQKREQLKSDGFEWTVLMGNSRREIYESYNVRILPTYVLIDPQGRMAGSQAPWPDENFEMQFANTLKATKR